MFFDKPRPNSKGLNEMNHSQTGSFNRPPSNYNPSNQNLHIAQHPKDAQIVTFAEDSHDFNALGKPPSGRQENTIPTKQTEKRVQQSRRISSSKPQPPPLAPARK